MAPQKQTLRQFAEVVDNFLEETYGQRILCTFPFGGEKADYISNGNQNDSIKALRAIADKLEKGEIIPVTEGED